VRGAEFQPRGLRLAAYISVFAFMVSLPQLRVDPGSVSGAVLEPSGAAAAEVAADRVAPASRAREVLTQARTPETLTSRVQADPEIQTYTVQSGDTLIGIAKLYAVDVITIAYNNGVTDAQSIHPGDVFRIPPFDAAIYKVKAGDSVDSVAAYFKVEPKAVMDANRLYYEPDKFGEGKEILIPEPLAMYPNFELKDSKRIAQSIQVTSKQIDTRTLPKPAGKLAWPVGGVITQYFWYGHKGVDIAAPFGTGIAASDAGVVSASGWVAVGGLRVCVRHSWGMETCYYHTSVVLVEVGQQVTRGQIVARIGMTGVTTGPHVHWEARYQGVLVNPLEY
jgi:murein DD-endopeptidase MepM/ murein hydrolase activator NlpD